MNQSLSLGTERAERIGVVGSGLMGREIAMIFALAGYKVLLTDQSPSALEMAKSRLDEILDKGIARGAYQAKHRDSLRNVRLTVDINEFAECDFITEAVFERLDVKTLVFQQLDAVCKPSCVFATNTSTIPIAVLASACSLARRGNFVGTHYFSPVSRMRLVELIPGIDTDARTMEIAGRFCREIGKMPIVIKDVPGFAVNRLLHVLMIEAVRLVEEGVSSPEDIDTACRLGLGHPMGPFELMDATTSSLCLQAQQIMFEAYGGRFRPRPLLKKRVQAGYVGGRGKPGWRGKNGSTS